jgi:hypothetical protein
MAKIDRRELLASAVAAALVPGLAVATKPAPNAIVRENSLPGTDEWQLTFMWPNVDRFRTTFVEGYCSHTSIRAGEKLGVFLSANPASDVTIDIYRMGYYGGKGGRSITRVGPLNVTPQLDPPVGKNRLRECKWAKAFDLEIGRDWISGVYVGKLSCATNRYQSYIIFIVRDDRKADVMFQCSDNTWQAYNKWPGSYSLYDADDPKQSLNGTTRVSFDRPYAKYWQIVDQPLSQGSGEFLCWEFPLCYWLESRGYDVTYVSNLDTHNDADGLLRAQVMLSAGHDEYWSLRMFDNVKRAIDKGLSVGFLSGNTSCFVAPLVPSSDGRPDRVFHRAGRYGGVMEIEKPKMGPFDLDGDASVPNERTLIGARTISPFNGSGDWTVRKADHWLFEGTGMKNGESISGLVGWEFHGDPAPIPGLEVVASGPTINYVEENANFAATTYPGPKNNWVFNAATIFWSMGLSDPPGVIPPHSHYGRPHGPDERVQKITSNFLARCGAKPVV